jgi:toxin CptA
LIALWTLAALLALVTGFALARGGICAVAAVRQVVEERRWRLFLSFVECAAWALLALIVANTLGVMAIDDWPAHMSPVAALAGGALFGAGALINGACAFGSAGRLAAGELSFLSIAPGFLMGVVLAHRLGADAVAVTMAAFAITGTALTLLTGTLVLFALWRVWTGFRDAPSPSHAAVRLAAPTWPPALAMAVIALTNVGLLLIVFAWPYTALLTDIGSGRGKQIALRIALVVIFLFGAFAGAALARRFKLRTGTSREWTARFVGGALMGLGAAFIPGGNDALVLMGLPLLQPEALAAYAAMVIVIAGGFVAQRAWLKRRQ